MFTNAHSRQFGDLVGVLIIGFRSWHSSFTKECFDLETSLEWTNAIFLLGRACREVWVKKQREKTTFSAFQQRRKNLAVN